MDTTQRYSQVDRAIAAGFAKIDTGLAAPTHPWAIGREKV